MVSSTARQKLRLRLEKLAQTQPADDQSERELNEKQSELNTITQQLDIVSSSLALIETNDQRAAITEIFNRRIEKKKQLESELDHLQKKAKPAHSSDSEVNQVMQLVRLIELAEQPEDFSKAKKIFDLTNLRMFFRFEPKKRTKRMVNK